MSLKYSLIENLVTSDPEDYRALPQDSESATEEDVVIRMTSRGSTATPAEIYGVLEEYKLAVGDILAEGRRINTDLLNIGVSIRGVFEGENDSYDPARHSLRVNIQPGLRLAKVVERIEVEKVRPSEIGPIIDHCTDVATGEIDSLLTPGGVAVLEGINLKIRPDLDESGVYLIASDGATTKAAQLARNKPAEVIFLIPALPAGDYRLEVRTTTLGSDTLRAGNLKATLTVTA